MEINQVKDLLPYRKSLEDIWESEEFQPVIKLCEAIKTGVTQQLQTLDAVESFKTAALAVRLSERINSTTLILELPKLLKQIEDQQEAMAKQKQTFVGAQAENSGVIAGSPANRAAKVTDINREGRV